MSILQKTTSVAGYQTYSFSDGKMMGVDPEKRSHIDAEGAYLLHFGSWLGSMLHSSIPQKMILIEKGGAMAIAFDVFPVTKEVDFTSGVALETDADNVQIENILEALKIS